MQKRVICSRRMRRERLIRPTKLCKFNTLQESNRPDRRSTSDGVTFVIDPPLF
ncbi:phosphopantetheinyl transferase [Escherichia coli]|nr:phosphopantetheinyl transferase [Escherichia coli]API15277.1 phosphopantetheinyl transferase [Escherichia coli]API20938.1 phosphopantetheinyl transferase [Escherichia coli]API37593.1 phosphopantetheinyl transferase [Escherichia coli]